MFYAYFIVNINIKMSPKQEAQILVTHKNLHVVDETIRLYLRQYYYKINSQKY